MAVQVLFKKANVTNNYESFQFRCTYADLKFHKSAPYHKVNPIWRRWKGGFKLRGKTHKIMNPNFHQKYNKPLMLAKIKRYYGTRNSLDALYNMHWAKV